MLTEKLYEGQVIKNYKEICKLLDEPIKVGKSKQLQFKDFERYFKYHKEGQRIVIDKMFDIPKDKIDNRGNKSGMESHCWKDYEQLKVSREELNNIGIYYILKDNDIYIGSTVDGFRNRFQAHYHGHDELMKHTYELLQNGGEFYILHDMTGIGDETLVRDIENEYIQYFINNSDYNVINKRECAWSFAKKQDKPKKEKAPKKIKYKTLKVKIQEDKYEKAMQLLIDNGLLDLEDNETPTNNYILNGIIQNDFDINNVPF